MGELLDFNRAELSPQQREHWERHLAASRIAVEHAERVLGIEENKDKEYTMSEQLFSDREFLEGQSPESLTKFILQHSARIEESERWIGLANEVLEGAYGTTIDAQLDLLNEKTETTST